MKTNRESFGSFLELLELGAGARPVEVTGIQRQYNHAVPAGFNGGGNFKRAATGIQGVTGGFLMAADAIVQNHVLLAKAEGKGRYP